MHVVFDSMDKLFKANKLILNSENPNVMKCTNSKTCINVNIRYDKKTTEEVEAIKFLFSQVDSRLNWKKNILNVLSLN
jgi:predicted fused transcriptional regulator/phosphomethylpyrimidine kinase